MVNNRVGRVADFESGLANSHRVFGILTEARGAWSEPRVKKPDLLENFALERHIGPGQAANLPIFVAVIDQGNIILPQPRWIGGFAFAIHARQDTSLKRIEGPPTITLEMSNNESRVDDDIVIENEKKITLCCGKSPVKSASFAFTWLRQRRNRNVARSTALLGLL